ncbi:toxin-antitoxin system, toxin component, partial [Streptomyces albus subsp. albus]
ATNLAAPHGIVPVRDSKNVSGPALTVPAAAFSAFVAGVRGGGFGSV